MTEIRDRLIQNARQYELWMRDRYYAEDPDETDDWYRAIHSHFLNSFRFEGGGHGSGGDGSGGDGNSGALSGEMFIEYWPIEFLMGDYRRREQLLLEPRRWSDYRYGSYGVGYLLVTNRRVFVVSLRDLTQRFSRFKTTLTSFLIGALAQDVSRMTGIPEDRTWEIQNANIAVAEIAYTENGVAFLDLRTSAAQWKVFAHFKGMLDVMREALTMAMDGTMAKLRSSTYFESIPDVLTASELHARMARNKQPSSCSDDEYEYGLRLLDLAKLADTIIDEGLSAALRRLYCASLRESSDGTISRLYRKLFADSYLYANLKKRDDVLVSLYLRMRYVPGLELAYSRLAENLPRHWLEALLPLPDDSHPNAMATLQVEGDVQAIAFSDSGSELITLARSIDGQEGRVATVFSMIDGSVIASRQVSVLGNMEATAIAVASTNMLATCWDRSNVALWRLPGLEEIGRVEIESSEYSAIHKMEFLPDSRLLLVWCMSPGILIAVNVSPDQLTIGWAHKPPAGTMDVLISPTGNWIVAYGYEGPFKVIDLRSKLEIAAFGNVRERHLARLSPEGSHVASWRDQRVRLFEVQSGKELAPTYASERLSGFTFGNDWNRVISKDDDGMLSIRRGDRQGVVFQIAGGDWAVLNLSHSLSAACTQSNYSTWPVESALVRVWNVAEEQRDHRPSLVSSETRYGSFFKSSGLQRTATHPDGKTAGIIVGQGDLFHFNIREDKSFQHDSYVGGLSNPWIRTPDLAFSSDGRFVAAHGYPPWGDEGLILLDGRTGAYFKAFASQIRFDRTSFPTVAFSSEGDYLLSLNDTGNGNVVAMVWDTGNFVKVGEFQCERVFAVVPGKGSEFVLLLENEVAIFDASTWDVSRRLGLPTHKNYYPSSYDRRGPYATTAMATCHSTGIVGVLERNGELTLVDLNSMSISGPQLAPLNGYASACSFSSSMDYCAVVGRGGTLAIWDVSTNTRLLSVHLEDELNDCAFFPSSSNLTVTGSKGMYLFDVRSRH